MKKNKVDGQGCFTHELMAAVVIFTGTAQEWASEITEWIGEGGPGSTPREGAVGISWLV